VATQQQVTQLQQVQTAQGGQQQAPTRLVLGQLPGGKLVLQGSQLAALTQARVAGQAGGQPKVLTIQLQVQQQPNQQGGVKVRKPLFHSVVVLAQLTSLTTKCWVQIDDHELFSLFQFCWLSAFKKKKKKKNFFFIYLNK